MTARSEFVDFVRPLHDRMDFYDPTRTPLDQPNNAAADPARACPQGFIDAMLVREEVYVKEQNVPLSNEFDDDDRRSFHWVAYASIPTKQVDREATATGTDPGRRTSNSTKIPIGTIRLVPPPHADHHAAPQSGPNGDRPNHSAASPSALDAHETYVKLGRLAVIKEFRKAGISKLLIETALAFARAQPHDVDGPQLDPTSIEAAKNGTAATSFRGLVLVHSQVGTKKVWAKYGFELDESMGVWDEEGIEHVGMWKRLDVSAGRSKAKVRLSGPIPLS